MTGDNKMSNERQKRNHRLDNIRAVAIIMIVLGHSIIIYSSSWNLYQTTVSVPVLDVLKDVINVMQLPIFFALSGYFFAYTLKKKNIVTIIRDKIKRLLVPFLAFGLLWLFPVRMLLDYPGYENAGLMNIIINKILFGSDNGHLWYLPTLFLIFTEKFHRIQQETVDIALKQNKFQQTMTIATSLVGQAVGYACYGFAAFRLWQGQISYGTMTMFVSMAGSLRGSFSSILNLMPQVIRAGISAERIMEITGLPRDSMENQEEAEEIKRRGKEEGVYVHMDSVDRKSVV